MEDRLLQNDRYIHRFTAKLKSLKPGNSYQYLVGSSNGSWSDVASFHTEAENTDKFSFIWFGDTHKSPKWGDLLQKSSQKYPEAAFYSIAGDLVSTGLYRDHWDELFHHAGTVFQYKPLMPVPGNHDNQDGLGAWMYQEMFSLPKNGPAGILPELTYAFNYGNALFLMIDATQPNNLQTDWIEKQLENTHVVWKFAMFHFPPYNYEEDYADIRQKWCTLFDKYHVDMVMSGHTHYYMRSKPVFNEKVVDDPSKGTIYVISVGIPGDHKNLPPEDYVVIQDKKGWRYQHIEINKNKLIYKSLDIDGNIKDEFVIAK
jgi:predicted phosphodiesterase